MKRLAVIPSDPLDEYEKLGTSAFLEEDYNPCHFFEKVYLLSPLERIKGLRYGMEVIPTEDRQLKKRIKELKIDVVRAYGGNWACDMACNYKVPGVTVVVSVHDRRTDWLHDSIKKADYVFAVSDEVKRLVITKFHDKEKIWNLPNRVDFDIMRHLPQKEVKKINEKFPFKYKILHVGRKSSEKNLDTVIKALEILGSEYGLIAIGNGNTEHYVNLAKEQGVSNQ